MAEKTEPKLLVFLLVLRNEKRLQKKSVTS